jgi:hypothetical protein
MVFQLPFLIPVTMAQSPNCLTRKSSNQGTYAATTSGACELRMPDTPSLAPGLAYAANLGANSINGPLRMFETTLHAYPEIPLSKQ